MATLQLPPPPSQPTLDWITGLSSLCHYRERLNIWPCRPPNFLYLSQGECLLLFQASKCLEWGFQRPFIFACRMGWTGTAWSVHGSRLVRIPAPSSARGSIGRWTAVCPTRYSIPVFIIPPPSPHPFSHPYPPSPTIRTAPSYDYALFPHDFGLTPAHLYHPPTPAGVCMRRAG